MAWACALGWSGLSPLTAAGQAAQPGVVLEIRADQGSSEACFTPEQLGSRVAYYRTRKDPIGGLRVVLELAPGNTARLRILRGGTLVSRRYFEQLPGPCADRRDAVALSIALALDHASETPPSAASVDGAGAQVEPAAPEIPPGAGAPPQPAPPATPPDPAAQPTAASSQSPAAPPTAAAPPPSAADAEPPNPPDAAPIIQGNLPSATSHSLHPDASAHALWLQLGGRWVTGALPFAVWAGSIGVELPLSARVTLDLAGLLSLRGEREFAGGQARGRLLGIEATGCRSVPVGAFALQGCGGVSIAASDVSGSAYPVDRPSTTVLWIAAVGRLAVRWPQAEVLSLRLLAQAHANLFRPELQVEGTSDVLRAGVLGATLGLELLWALP